MEPVASAIPYHVAVGNQEHWNGYAGYEARFSMNATSRSTWHDANLGVVKAIFISTEHNYTEGTEQYAYLEATLASVDRAVTPWVVVLMHRPLYCSSNDYYDCVRAAPELRATFEPLFVRYGVDLVVAGHVHHYERTAPVINGTVVAAGPVHVVVGNAGDVEGLTRKFEPAPAWSRSRAMALGWGRLAASRSTLTVEHVSSENGTILDSFSLSKAPRETPRA